MAPIIVGERTERHLYTLFRVEDDRRVILGTIMNEHDVDKVTLPYTGS